SEDRRVAPSDRSVDPPEAAETRPLEGRGQQCETDAVVLPRVRDRDGHLDVLGIDRLQAQVADDQPPATVTDDCDQPFTMHVVEPAERHRHAVVDPARAPVEARVKTVPREPGVEALEWHDVIRADGPDRDATRDPRIVHGLSVPSPPRSREGRTARTSWDGRLVRRPTPCGSSRGSVPPGLPARARSRR